MARDLGEPDSGESLLTLDLGNSTLDWMLSGPAGAQRGQVDPDDREAVEALLEPRPDAVLACSVVAARMRPVADWIADAGVPFALAGAELPCPLQLRYHDPAELGADRWVAAVAAERAFGAAVVVDCGTAVTVDVVSERCHLGGAIAPGWAAMAYGLERLAPGLPAVSRDPGPRDMPPRTSEDAVRAGLLLGFAGSIERLVSEVESASGVANPARVLTGGEAELYLAHGRLEFAHVPDLLHRGLRLLWADHRDGK